MRAYSEAFINETVYIRTINFMACCVMHAGAGEDLQSIQPDPDDRNGSASNASYLNTEQTVTQNNASIN